VTKKGESRETQLRTSRACKDVKKHLVRSQARRRQHETGSARWLAFWSFQFARVRRVRKGRKKKRARGLSLESELSVFSFARKVKPWRA